MLGKRLGGPPADLARVDWPLLVELAGRNRVGPLVQQTLSESGYIDPPVEVRRTLREIAHRSFIDSTLAAQPLGAVADVLSEVRWLVLRGPALGATLYGDLMLRPYGDLDVLVSSADFPAAYAALQSVGFSAPPDALPVWAYRRYHLHAHLVSGENVLELHWALDHPFALSTVDVDGILARADDFAVGEAQARMPCPVDLLLMLAAHAVKHAVQLPLWAAQRAPTPVVEGGYLLQLFDIALATRIYGRDFNWSEAAERASAWGVSGDVRACLDAIDMLWPTCLPAEVGRRFARTEIPRWRRDAYRRLESGPAAFEQRTDVFFRPVRLLDGLTYLLPPADYLRRRYGAAHLLARGRHLLRAVDQLAGAGLALVGALVGRLFSRNRDSDT